MKLRDIIWKCMYPLRLLGIHNTPEGAYLWPWLNYRWNQFTLFTIILFIPLYRRKYVLMWDFWSDKYIQINTLRGLRIYFRIRKNLLNYPKVVFQITKGVVYYGKIKIITSREEIEDGQKFNVNIPIPSPDYFF